MRTIALIGLASLLAAGTPADAGEYRAEAEALVRTGFGSEPVRLLTAAETPAGLAAFDAVWLAPGVTGAIRILPTADGSPVELIGRLLAGNAEVCTGRFASSRVVDPASGAVRARSACDNDAIESHYLVSPRTAGGWTLMIKHIDAGAR
jgi:hypothetical protein